MINRGLLRVKVVQILYSYYKSESKSLPLAEKELLKSIENTYDLYFYLLQLSIEITRFAAEKIEIKRNKLRPTQEDLNPNTRFVDNTFIEQLSKNVTFLAFQEKKHLNWIEHSDIIKELYQEIKSSDIYEDYMNSSTVDYSSDKDLWRKIYKKILLNSQSLDDSLEEKSIYWADDIELVISFIIKTIKRFQLEEGKNQALLPMFKDEEDAEFAFKLLRSVLNRNEELRAMIDRNTKNWELDRIAFMDIVIMEVALAELTEFPTIPVNVTLNEYIEIAKNYSTEKSGTFINGVLDKIVVELKKENKLIKVVMFTDNKAKKIK